MDALFRRMFALETRAFRLDSATAKDGVKLLAMEQDLRNAQQRLATVFGTVFGDHGVSGPPPTIIAYVTGCDGLPYAGVTVNLVSNSDHTTILGTKTTDSHGLADFGNPSLWPSVFDLTSVVPTGKRYAGVTLTGVGATPSIFDLGLNALNPATDTVCTTAGWWPPTLYFDGTIFMNLPGGFGSTHTVSGKPLTWSATYKAWIGELTVANMADYTATCVPQTVSYGASTTYIVFSLFDLSITLSRATCFNTSPSTPQIKTDPGGNYPPPSSPAPLRTSGLPDTSDLTNLIYTYKAAAFTIDGQTYPYLHPTSDFRVDTTP